MTASATTQSPGLELGWVGCLRNIAAFCGLLPASRSLRIGLCREASQILGRVSAANISVPGGSGDRFDDWLVGPQFEPYYFHHSATPAAL
jgi:hypothetical protein